MKYKGIIFDMDGTITDSEHIWRESTKQLIVNKGASLTDEEHEELNNRLKGLALHASCEVIKNEVGLEHPLEELIQEQKKLAMEIFEQGLKFIEGFENFHDRVLEKNLKTGIATNADDHTIEKTDNHLDLKRYFGEHIYGISHVNHIHKPAPDLYLHVADKLDLNPQDCVAIEDSPHGVKAAVDAGMFCIGINTAGDRDKLKEAHLVVETYDEICLYRLLKIKKNIPE